MKASGPPLRDGFSAIHGSVPSNLETLHEGLKKLEIDNVVFDDENVDRWDGAVEKTGWKLGRVRFGFALRTRGFGTGR